MSSLIGSEVLLGLSEYDGYATLKLGAAEDTLPQALLCVMSFSVRKCSLHAREPIQTATVLSQTKKDTIPSNSP